MYPSKKVKDMERLVLYIEKEKFLRQMLEEIFKIKGAKLHTESTLDENFYLIEDLAPAIIVFDLDSFGANKEQNMEKLLSYSNIIFIATGNPNQLEAKDPRIHKCIQKPIQASAIFDQIFAQ
jgi:DNA-binding NtrC family response regulator